MTKVTIDRALIEQVIELLDKGVCDFWSQYDDKAEGIIQELRAGLAEPAVEPETVSVFGVKPNGEVVDTGVKAQTPPRMKAKDLVNEMYGRTWEQDDGSESDLCFAVCEEFFEWLIAQGWKASPPPPAEPAPVPCGYDETTGNCTHNPCCFLPMEMPPAEVLKRAAEAACEAVAFNGGSVQMEAHVRAAIEGLK